MAKVAITGHRYYKLKNYDIGWIIKSIEDVCLTIPIGCGMSGMASGVDLWFCDILSKLNIPYIACFPFSEQSELVESFEKHKRQELLRGATKIIEVRNSYMIEKCDMCIVVWDGNKGGTHNCVQQLVENNKPFYWINPVGEKIWQLL